MSLQVPSAYAPGHEKARKLDPVLADAYVAHTLMADPLADAAIESLDGLSQAARQGFISAAMDGDEAGMRGAPAALKEFFDSLTPPPAFSTRI